MRIRPTKKLIFFSFHILFSIQAIAQSINKVAVINSDKGLSQNSVYSICKDSMGFLWIGTGDGLNRYDGKDFVTFRNTSVESANNLKGFSIGLTMHADNRNNLWFSTERNLVQFDQPSKTFTEIIPFNTPSERGNKIIASLDTLQNTIWFLAPGKTLYSYNYVTKNFNQYKFPFLEDGKNLFLDPYSVADNHGNIWITSSDGLFRFNKKTSTWKRFHKGYNFRKICIDIYGKIWMVNINAIYSFDPITGSLNILNDHPSKSTPYSSIAADNKGKVWCGTLEGKLYYCSSQNNDVVFAGDVNKISGSKNVLELTCLYIDPSDLLWIGTEGGGVIKFDLNPKIFNNFPSLENTRSVGALYIKSILCDDDGKVWLGTFKKGLYIFDPATSEAIHLHLPVRKNSIKYGDVIYSIKKDEEGIYWLAHDKVLIAYKKETNQYFYYPLPIENNNSRHVINHISVQKNQIVLSSTAGLYQLTKARGRITSAKRLLGFSVMESLFTSDGSLWISTVYDGLKKMLPDKDSSFSTLFAENGFRCLTEDKENKILWAASQTGLLAYHLPTGKFRFYNESHGLLNSYLYGIINYGNEIWVSTNRGLAKGVLTFKEKQPLPEISFKGYTKEDGLQSDEFNTGAYGQGPDGTIYFGGINGLNWFLPKDVSNNHHKPKVAITSLKINDTPYLKNISPEYQQSLTTHFNNNTFTIKFIGLEFSNPHGIHYLFKLDGLEKEWTTEQNSREVRYANLPPGKYTFRVIATNSDKVMSDEATLSFNILPPFYGTWWFRVIITAALLFFVIFITQKLSRIKLKKKIRLLEKQKALEDERHRISKEMHDDLGAGLTQISLISEAAKRRNMAGKFPLSELNDISKTSKLLIENVSEIIWAMNPEFDTLSSMIAYLREQLSKLLEYSGKQYYLLFPEDYEELNIANIKRKNISMLLKEAVNNAIKHSNATSVYVKMALINNCLEIEVKDNGQGFDLKTILKGHGVKNYEYRTGLLNGTSKIVSNDSGTEVYFKIPLKD